MQYILSLLPVLVCPVGMGLMVWLMMRMGKEQTPPDASPQQEDRRVASPLATPMTSTSISSEHTSPLKAIWDCVQMCLNWKVLAGLAVVGVIVWLVAPRLVLAALPVLLVLACPLSMLFMMGGMRSSQGTSRSTPAGQPQLDGFTHEEQIARLQAELASKEAQLESLARESAGRGSSDVPAEPAGAVQRAKKRSGRRDAPNW